MEETAMEKVSLLEKFGKFQDHWSPKIAAELNDHQVKLVKLQGEFLWHHHEDVDELFLVVKGRLTIRFRDREIVLEPNELVVVPRRVEHMPVAEEETWIVLLEPRGTLNTGNVTSDRTVEELETI
jgi:mannose-6-phosphate isomerase-like protein (cupin superfamily)